MTVLVFATVGLEMAEDPKRLKQYYFGTTTSIMKKDDGRQKIKES